MLRLLRQVRDRLHKKKGEKKTCARKSRQLISAQVSPNNVSQDGEGKEIYVSHSPLVAHSEINKKRWRRRYICSAAKQQHDFQRIWPAIFFLDRSASTFFQPARLNCLAVTGAVIHTTNPSWPAGTERNGIVRCLLSLSGDSVAVAARWRLGGGED